MAISMVLDRPGLPALDLAALGYNAVRYSTAVNSGFSAASLTAPDDVRRQVPLLGTLRILNDDAIVWEGQVEDRELDLGARATAITAFGKQRLLQLGSVNRSWSLRALQFQNVLANVTLEPNLEVHTGFLDIANPSLRGVRILGKGLAVAFGKYSGASVIIPSASRPLALLGDIGHAGSANLGASMQAYDSTGAAPWAALPSIGTIVGSTSFSYDLTTVPASTAAAIGLAGACTAGTTFAITDYVDFTNLRLLGTSVSEDTVGGYYAHTLIRDVLTFVPGITPGNIDTATEFVIQELDRSTRSNVLSVIQEIAAYFTREWGVWECGRFDWKQPNLSEPGWTITLADVLGGKIKQTVDGLARDTYVTYTDPTDQRQKEASYQTTRLTNDFLRNGLKSDDVQAPGLGFIPATASAYAQAANLRTSQIPAAQGSIIVPAWKLFPSSVRTAAPALEIRAGDNITIPDFPTDDAFSGGQDNQTLFHVIQTDVDLTAGTVTLTIAGYLPSLDVLTARLNAVSKVATS